jgi:hypothetical protein
MSAIATGTSNNHFEKETPDMVFVLAKTERLANGRQKFG